MPQHMDWMFDASKRAIEKASGTLWPHRSIVSGVPSGDTTNLTPEDFAKLSFITGPVCDACGVPQDAALADGAMCAPCLAKAPKWRSARAALVYDDFSARPILALKRAGRRDGLETMATWMHRAAGAGLIRSDLITAVPLHRSRLAARGYNQAVWLAAALARRAGVPVQADLLTRQRNTPSQGGLSSRARKRNVSGAFAVPEKYQARIAGRDVTLVDDVLTTGATVEACVTALKQAGARAVDVVTVARVVRERDTTI